MRLKYPPNFKTFRTIIDLTFSADVIITYVTSILPYILVDDFPFLKIVAYASLVLVLLGIIGVIYIFRHTSELFKALMYFMLVGTAAIALSMGNLVFYLNMWLDNSPPYKRTERIVDKHISYGYRNSPSYKVILNSWHNNKPAPYPFTFHVNEQTYTQIKTHSDYIQLELHSGFFGIEWIEQYNLVPDGAPK
jgi:hypothetical protein